MKASFTKKGEEFHLNKTCIGSLFFVYSSRSLIGYTEAVFALTDLLGFASRIAKLYKQNIYAFEKNEQYSNKGFPILPNGYINIELIEENWEAILRLHKSLNDFNVLGRYSASLLF